MNVINFTNKIKDKSLESKYKITQDNVKDAYPDIVWGNRS